MKRFARLLVPFLILIIAFPLGWLGDFNPAFRRWFNDTFNPDWVHVVMHLALFGLLSYILAVGLERPGEKTRIALIFAIILLAGVLQEGFQLWWKGFRPGFGEVYDLVVDLTGAASGLFIYQWVKLVQTRRFKKP